MESSKEQIEAQLCAYIDGELGDSERAEIERHLATNPQHKALIAELRRHSGLLQDLPRAPAPLELNEALCGQLERSALLNPSEEENSQNVLSINRWPQITAVAAVLMLAIGLGIVVYYVLPPSSPNNHGPLAIDQNGLEGGRRHPVSQPGKTEVDTRFDAGNITNGSRDKDSDRNKPYGRADLQSSIDPQTVRAGDIRDGRLITATEVEEFQKLFKLSRGGNQAFNLDNSSLCLVVSTNDTAAASSQVASYFKTNRIQYLSYEDSVSLADWSGLAQDSERRGNENKYGYGVSAPEGEKRYTGKAAENGQALGGGAGGTGGNRGARNGAFAGGGGGGGYGGEASSIARADSKKLDEAHDVANEADTLKAKVNEENRSRAVKQGDLASATPAPAPTAPTTSRSSGQAAPPAPAKPGAVVEGTKFASKVEEAPQLEREPAKGTEFRKDDSGVKEKGAEQVIGKGLRNTDLAPSDPSTPRPEVDLSKSQQTPMDAIHAPLVRENLGRPGVIMARMNRRQANELSEVLSREAGQRTELRRVNIAETKRDLSAEVAGRRLEDQASEFAVPSELSISAASAGAGNKALAAREPTAPVVAQQQVDPSSAVVAQRQVDPPSGAVTGSGVLSNPKTRDAFVTKDDKRAAGGNVTLRAQVPTTQPGGVVAKDAFAESADVKSTHGNSEVPNLNIQRDPLDEPVDVYIFVKDDRIAPTVPSIQLGVPKGGGEKK